MRAPVFLILALATAACGGRQSTPQANVANAAAPAGAQVAALSEGQRNAVFIRAIRDAGLDCQHVQRSVLAGSEQDMPIWRATCQGGRDYAIAIGADGTAQILPDAGETNAVAPANGQ